MTRVLTVLVMAYGAVLGAAEATAPAVTHAQHCAVYDDDAGRTVATSGAVCELLP